MEFTKGMKLKTNRKSRAIFYDENEYDTVDKGTIVEFIRWEDWYGKKMAYVWWDGCQVLINPYNLRSV